jgi:hypothetical protein
MGDVIREHGGNPSSSEGGNDREASRNHECEGDERVRPGEFLPGSRDDVPLDPLNLNLWNVCEIGIPREDDESVSDGGSRDPEIHHARTPAGGSSVRNDRGEGMSDL